MTAFTKAVAGTLTSGGSKAVKTTHRLASEIMPGLGDIVLFWTCQSGSSFPQSGDYIQVDKPPITINDQGGAPSSCVYSSAASHSGAGNGLKIDAVTNSAFKRITCASPLPGLVRGRVGFWFKARSIISGPNESAIFIYAAGASLIRAGFTNSTSTRIRYGGTDGLTRFTSWGFLTIGQWYFLEVAYDFAVPYIRPYMDGVLLTPNNNSVLATGMGSSNDFDIGNSVGLVTISEDIDTFVISTNPNRNLYKLVNTGLSEAWQDTQTRLFTYKKTLPQKAGVVSFSGVKTHIKYVARLLKTGVLSFTGTIRRFIDKRAFTGLLDFEDVYTNLIPSNPGFESGLTDWTTSHVIADTVDYYEGLQSAQMESLGSFVVSYGSLLARSFTGLPPDQEVLLSFRVLRTTPINNPLFIIVAEDSGMGNVLHNNNDTFLTEWYLYEVPLIVPTSGELYLQFELAVPGLGVTNRFHVDDVQIHTLITESSPGTLYKKTVKLFDGAVSFFAELFYSIGKFKFLQGFLSFIGIRYASRDGDCLVDYPEEPCGEATYSDVDDCTEPVLVEETAISFSSTEEDCTAPVYTSELPAPLSVFNIESDGCPLHDEDQEVSYTPPSRGSAVDFNGHLTTRLLGIRRGVLSFNGYLLRGRKFVGNLTFNGDLVATPSNPISPLAPWAWWRADNVFGDNTSPANGDTLTNWQDVSGNGNHLTANGFKENGTASVQRPKWFQAGDNKGMTAKPAVSFEGIIAAFAESGMFSLASTKNLLRSAGFTFCFTYRDYTVALTSNYLLGGVDSDGNDDKVMITDPGDGLFNNTRTGNGVSEIFFGSSYSHTGPAREYFVLRCDAAVAGNSQLRQWANGSLTSGGVKNTDFQLRYLGMHETSFTNRAFTRFKSIGEMIVFDRALNDSEVAIVNSWLAGRI